MKILALDQASRTTGYSIYENGSLIQHGKFTFTDDDFGIRLTKIRNKIKSLLTDFAIDELIYEDIQLQDSANNNVDTFKKLAQVYGVVTQLATELAIPHKTFYSTVWKSGIGVKGKNRTEQKKAAQELVFQLYGIKASEDECDAICIGRYACDPKPLKTCAW